MHCLSANQHLLYFSCKLQLRCVTMPGRLAQCMCRRKDRPSLASQNPIRQPRIGGNAASDDLQQPGGAASPAPLQGQPRKRCVPALNPEEYVHEAQQAYKRFRAEIRSGSLHACRRLSPPALLEG